MKKIFTIFIYISLPIFSFSQGIINNGANFYIAEGAIINAGTFTNSSDNPEINLNGTINLEGDWINNSTSNVFVNIENTPNGSLILSGTEETNISGSKETFFENLTIQNAIKTLHVSNCEINGIFSLNGILDLNSNKLILNNHNDIDYVSGYILSETTPNEGLGELEIMIGNSEKTFNIPFGSGKEENDLNLIFTTNNAGSPSNGSVIFATYPTDVDNNPLPNGINNLGDISTDKTIDRFWEIAPNFSVNPDFLLNLSYTDNELNNNSIEESKLSLIRYNTDIEQWNDAVFSTEINSNNNNALITSISGNNFFNFWTLAEVNAINSEFEIPNGITPNDDGFNDTWVIDGLPENTQVIIYNRWGDKVFQRDNYENNWDGRNLPSGAYYYIINLSTGETLNGDVNLLK